MTRYLTLDEVLDLHRWALQAFGGSAGLLNPGLLDSALASPQSAFGGVEAYPTLFEKAGALAFSLAKNHPFVDGNKRVAFWSMAVFLRLNGQELVCSEQEGVDVFLALAASQLSRAQLVAWIVTHCQPLDPPSASPATTQP